MMCVYTIRKPICASSDNKRVQIDINVFDARKKKQQIEIGEYKLRM